MRGLGFSLGFRGRRETLNPKKGSTGEINTISPSHFAISSTAKSCYMGSFMMSNDMPFIALIIWAIGEQFVKVPYCSDR